ncbi:hypothetical protein PVAG01_08445 [Phlyctema vagabunda]|uniref:Cytochrome P450 n=1 Tax=Phlyctema vagabunda TaxID=108571 RepID=A0ABR4PA43_9HELO
MFLEIYLSIKPYIGWLAIISFATYLTGLSIYRLYFHPLSKFPGPKIAAITQWYEVYFDVYLRGQYQFHIRELHKQYGPILRISPFEIHINDSAFIDELYAGGGKKRDRWTYVQRAAGFPESSASSGPHELHRMRRAAVAPFFSKQSARNLQPVVDGKIDKILDRLRKMRGNYEVFRVEHMCSAYNVVMEYSFGRSEDRLSKPDFDPGYHEAIAAGLPVNFIIRHFYMFLKPVLDLPEWITQHIPMLRIFTREKRVLGAQVQSILDETNTAHTGVSHPTIFHEILSSKLPPHEKTLSRLTQEAQVIVAAGTVTVAWSIAFCMFHLLTTPALLRRLKDELREAIPDPSIPPRLVQIENLPFLKALIQETLRLSYGATHRLARIAQEEDLVYKSPFSSDTWTIPRGTPVSMSALLLHHNEEIFPDSFTFNPSRWLEDGDRLDQYFVPFSKGSRICVGINLAYGELFLFLARVFRVYGSVDVRDDGDEGIFELFETTYRDIETVADHMLPGQRSDSLGVRVMVKE